MALRRGEGIAKGERREKERAGREMERAVAAGAGSRARSQQAQKARDLHPISSLCFAFSIRRFHLSVPP